jgi:DNA-binding LytR/AlgR family response regulator
VDQLRAVLGSEPVRPDTPRLNVIRAQLGVLVHRVPLEQVPHFEAADKYVCVVTAERERLIRLSIAQANAATTRLNAVRARPV